jgi:hypothetical protein
MTRIEQVAFWVSVATMVAAVVFTYFATTRF